MRPMMGDGSPSFAVRSSSGYCAACSALNVSFGRPSWSASFCASCGTTGSSSAVSRYTTSAASLSTDCAPAGSVFTVFHGSAFARNWFAA